MKLLGVFLMLVCGLRAEDPFRVKVTGHGRPMILVPGLSSSGETWDTTVAHYKDRFECHVLTVAGFAGVPRVPEIFLLESEGNFTRVHFGQERPLIRRSLNALEEQLDPAMFFRAGRKEIVNLKWIEKVDLAVAGGLVVTLRGGRQVEMSRRQSVRLREAMSL